jgi:hypothetical protein
MGEVCDMAAAAAVWMELSLLCLGALVLFLRRGYTLGEAGICSVACVLMALSLLLQACALAGAVEAALVLEAALALGAARLSLRHRGLLAHRWRGISGAARGHAIAATAFILCLGYLAGLCFLLPPAADHWPALAGLLRHPLIGGLGPAGIPVGTPPAGPLNAAVLPYLFLRFHTDYGVNGLGAMAFLAVVCGTYALARRHAWPPTAFTVTLVVASLPRVVLQAATPGLEIIPAAVSLFCMVCVYRLVEQAAPQDVALLAAGLVFVAFSGRMGSAMAAVLCIAASVLLLRRHGAVYWWGMIRRSRWTVCAVLPPVLLFSPIGRLARERLLSEGWTPPTGAAFRFNPHGLPGALDNALRYLIQSVDLTLPVDGAIRWAAGFSPAGLLEGAYRALAALIPANPAAGCPLALSWLPWDTTSWFGPLSVLLVLPAVIYAAWRGSRRLRVIAVGLIGYFYLVALAAAWSPANAGLFTAWFVCGGYLVAHLLPPWRISRRGNSVLQALCTLLIGYVLLFNVSMPAVAWRFAPWRPAAPPADCPGGWQPLLPPDAGRSIWADSRWGTDRWVHARRRFGDDRVARIRDLVSGDVRVGLVARTAGDDYPFLAALPDVEFHRLDPAVFENAQLLAGLKLERVLFVDTAPLGGPPGLTDTVLWQADPFSARLPGALVRIGSPP